MLLIRSDVKRIALIGAVGSVAAYGAYIWLSVYRPGSRSVYFIHMLMNADTYTNPTNQLSRDGSVMLRFSDMIFCLEGFIRDFGLPHDFSAGKMSGAF